VLHDSLRGGGGSQLLAHHLNQHLLLPPPVELAIKNLLSRAEVELAGGDGDAEMKK
jgi:hypothetical protein